MPNQTEVTKQDVEQCNAFAETVSIEVVPELLIAAFSGKKPVANVKLKGTEEKPAEDGGTEEDSDENPTVGLVLTEQQIIDIKKYVAYGLALPTEEGEVKRLMHYDASFDAAKYPDIAPAKFVELNTKIHSHCAQWSDLEAAIKLQGTKLEQFSESLTSTGGAILEVIKSMPVYKRAIESLEKYGKEHHEVFQFKDEDKEYQNGILRLLPVIKEAVTARQKDSAALVEKVAEYRRDMDVNIVGKTGAMKNSLKNLADNPEKNTLMTQKAELDEEIDNLNKQYHKMTGYAFTGASGLFFGPVGIISWAVTGGVFGDKAEKVRKKRNKLSKERDELARKLDDLDKLAAWITEEQSCISKQSMVLGDALIAIKNLDTVWAAIQSYIDSAMDTMNLIKDSDALILFQTRMESVVKSWTSVGGMTRELVRRFNEAEKKAAEAK